MIPTPINIDLIKYTPLVIDNKINIFCGINTNNQHAKGIPYFIEALNLIEQKYGNNIYIQITKNIPYKEYINIYNNCHIFLDQCLSYDQGYNGREAMAKGKVVFSGASKEFRDFYNIKNHEMPLIEAKPDVEYLVNKLSELIENPQLIIETSKRARKFIEKEHNYITSAQKYIDTWKRTT